AGEGGTAALLPRLTASLAESFALREVEVLFLGDRPVDEVATHPALREALACGQPCLRDGRLAAALFAPAGAMGFLTADCDGEWSIDELELFGAAAAAAAVLVQRGLELDELERLSRLKS